MPFVVPSVAPVGIVMARPPAGVAAVAVPVASVGLRNDRLGMLRVSVSALPEAAAAIEGAMLSQFRSQVALEAALVLIQHAVPGEIATPVPAATPTKLSLALGVTVTTPV